MATDPTIPHDALPDPIHDQIREIVAKPADVQAAELAALCERYPDRSDVIRRFARLERSLESAAFEAFSELQAGDVVGRFEILEKLGEGGMGSVYTAEQKAPIRRRVALKVIKLGMDTKAVLTRFDAERQALAMMEHECIAKVFDAGATDRGSPFFAMEYVEGVPITDYCETHQLGIEDRLRLIQAVCRGVQHAHQKGVIHRDLTPRNVLVTTADGVPTPKIIDFGLARATDRQLVEGTIFTQQGAVVGTPQYMSPEQAGLDGLDIDTRTDVYSIGVLLYELLVGQPPFSMRDLSSYLDLQQRIRESEPTKPSGKVSSAAGSRWASLRCNSVGEVIRRLRGDLDWIVMKALEKDRRRRYQTPTELADDLERHLRNEPVAAGPPSVRYRLGKFVRRYRGRVAVAAVLLIALLSALIVSNHYRVVAETARDAEADQRLEAQTHLGRFNLLANVIQLDRAKAAEPELYPAHPPQLDALRSWLDEFGYPLVAKLPELQTALSELEPAADGAATGDEFLRTTLTELVADLRQFERDVVGAVIEREGWASQLQQLSIDAHGEQWANATAALRARDPAIELEPQIGLVPIGENPVTGRWEFYHLRSAADPEDIPVHGDDGSIEVTGDTGIVFVLVPPGEFVMGSQNDDESGPNYDPFSRTGETLSRQTVAAFFLARHELTQAQWQRLAGDNPSFYRVGLTPQGVKTITAWNPVEQVSWNDVDLWLGRHGLRLPNESEWEYACRATTDTPWSFGTEPELLVEYANVADRNAAPFGPDFEPWDDGHYVHAPVGSFKPNPWGFHDMHGNVMEWCSDEFPAGNRIFRGGGFVLDSSLTRSAFRRPSQQVAGNQFIGARAARSIDP